jgi:hypothetical protein
VLRAWGACAGGAWTAPHVDFCGVDSTLYAVSGEKLWVLGPPESSAAFHALFTRPRATARIRFDARERRAMEAHGIRVVHQRADELVYVPSGWVHMVKHLTDTVCFGHSYLRPWRMGELMQYAQRYGLDTARRCIHVAAVVRRWSSAAWQAEWGLSHAYVEAVRKRWATLLRRAAGPDAAHASADVCDPHDADARPSMVDSSVTAAAESDGSASSATDSAKRPRKRKRVEQSSGALVLLAESALVPAAAVTGRDERRELRPKLHAAP